MNKHWITPAMRVFAWASFAAVLIFIGGRVNRASAPASSTTAPNSLEPRRPRFFRSRDAIEEQWPDAAQFLAENAPHYLDAIRSLSKSLPEEKVFRLHAAVVNRYQILRRMREHYPELFAARIQQLQLFDKLFDTHQQFVAASGPQKEKLKGEMKEEIGELVDNSIKDRRLRINQLRQMLGKLDARVERETKDRDMAVESHLRRVLERGVDPSLLDGMYQNELDSAPRHEERVVPTVPVPRPTFPAASQPAAE
jgi:hypothetical protein